MHIYACNSTESSGCSVFRCSGIFCILMCVSPPAAAYTYYTSLCQDEAHKRKGIYAQRKTQRRRRERVVRVSVKDAHNDLILENVLFFRDEPRESRNL